jgi:hypothetical protein
MPRAGGRTDCRLALEHMGGGVAPPGSALVNAKNRLVLGIWAWVERGLDSLAAKLQRTLRSLFCVSGLAKACKESRYPR